MFNLLAQGSLNKLTIKQFYLKALETTIDTKGQINFISNPDKLFMDLNIKRIRTGASDLAALLPDSTLPASISVPDEIFLTGNYKGTLSDFTSTMNLSSSIGNALVHANMSGLQQEIPAYQLALQTHNFNLGKLLNQTMLGELNGALAITGSGLDTSTFAATVHSDIESISINAYNYHSIQFNGTLNKQLVEVEGTVADSNLNLSLAGKANLDKQQEFYDLKLNLKGADLQKLKLTKEHTTVSANTDLHLDGDPTKNINGHISTRNILVIQNGKRYKEDSLVLVSVNEPGKSNVKLNSSMFAATFDGNIDVLSVSGAVTNHLNRYFHFTNASYKKTNPQNFTFEVQVNDSPLLREAVLPSLSQYSSMHINGSFNSEEAKLTIQADVPSATYSGTTVNDFTFNLNSDQNKITYNTGWEHLGTGGINLEETIADGTIGKDTAGINLTIKNTDGKDKIKLNSILTITSGNHYRFSILKDGLSLQEEKWTVADKNYIEIGHKYIFAEHFDLSHNTQFIKLQSAAEGNDIDLQFKAFNLHTLSQIIEDDTLLVQGILDGEVNFKHIRQNPAFTSQLNIKDLAYKDSRVGNLKIAADNLTADRYTATVALRDSLNRATIAGYYAGSSSDLHFNADIQSIELHSIEAFSAEQIHGSTGKIKGNIAITGTPKDPEFNGNIQFIDASTKVAYINQRLFMKKETINISPERVTFNSFNILDSLNNEAVINGYVGIKTFDDVTFNLTVNTNDFMVLNTTAVNNKLYYGKVILDSKISIKGDQNLPVINADINIVRGSHFTFAVPDSKVTVDRGDGIVIFTSDSSSLDPIMLRQTDELAAQKITGLDLSAKIHINRNSTLKLLVDPISGDSLSVRGDADLNFKMDESGQTSLSGRYVVYDGSYKASLENLIVRKFNITRGSTIIWSGDPTNALVDIKATYETRTAPDGLLANSAVIDSSALRKPLPFIVIMSMQGELLKPLISFQLDMPDNTKGALGGEVYSQISNINANESEVNKQVFALLVLNRFIVPDNTGSSGGASDFARRSVSRMMSNELNKLSAKYVEGLQIDVDVQSYNQINNGEQKGNTQVEVGVSKSLLNERLTVQIGGNVPLEGQDAATNSNAKNITGDVQVEYKITKNGRYKIKAFRINQYDGILNGNIVETGAGIMYVRNFTHFKELFISKKKKKKLIDNEDQQ
ncbi:MAG: translocation/assembly module TamB domain-containing protein [Cytophaga sp.]|uniref:translocation/assembly module TamB domain-containing protein n=1 Tax=Cytophaga sp. TaxID=29535 RepID=UPI003F7D1F2D